MAGAADAGQWRTEIAQVVDDDVIVRGYQLSELIGQITYVEMVFLVMTGSLPDEGRRRMLDAIFVSVTEHGISPSSIISRMLASCGTPIQAAVAGGVLSVADYHGGAGEQLARALSEAVAAGASESTLLAELEKIVKDHRKSRKPVEGFGHPQHPDGDPRARLLLRFADELGVGGRYTVALRQLAALLSTAIGRPMHPNVNGAIAAILLDLGFPWQSVRGFIITPRTIGLLAHVVEELQQGNRWRHAPSNSVEYVGPPPKAFNQPKALRTRAPNSNRRDSAS